MRVGVGMRVGEGGGGGNGQFAVADTLGANEAIGDGADLAAGAFENEDLQAVVVVEVDVESGDDGIVVFVLHPGELLAERADVVVVDEGECADDRSGGRLTVLSDELIADQIAEGFGAVGVAAALDVTVEFLDEIGIDGHADAGDTLGGDTGHAFIMSLGREGNW